jgi:hypothetical protein
LRDNVPHEKILNRFLERGRSSTGWLRSARSFSFGDYFDLHHQGHGNLLVLNDDTMAPGKGFRTHGHHDMEIVGYVLDGALQVNGIPLAGGDGALLEAQSQLNLSAGVQAEVLVFELARK